MHQLITITYSQPMKMVNTSRYLALLTLLLCIAGIRPAGAQDQVHRVLFVGNSYTYFNSMPQLFAAMTEHCFPDHRVETKFLGGGGATMKKHWEVGLVAEALEAEEWDYVVLQGQSMLGSDDLTDPDSPKEFYKYAEILHEQIKANGAEAVFFMTWSRENLKDQQVYLTKAYTHIGEKLSSKVSPIGLVWDKLRDNPSLELYQDDGSHPSISGSYLAAMTLSATVYGSCEGEMPGTLSGFEILRGGALAEEKSQLSNLPASEVRLMQEAVGEVVK